MFLAPVIELNMITNFRDIHACKSGNSIYTRTTGLWIAVQYANHNTTAAIQRPVVRVPAAGCRFSCDFFMFNFPLMTFFLSYIFSPEILRMIKIFYFRVDKGEEGQQQQQQKSAIGSIFCTCAMT
jgi:hypothetical protein